MAEIIMKISEKKGNNIRRKHINISKYMKQLKKKTTRKKCLL